MDAAIVWAALIIPSIGWGVLCAFQFNNKYSGFLSGAIPWLALLAAILYSEYGLPYQGGGASLWPIAQLFGGTVAAAVGYFSYQFSSRYANR
jgi:hypothetical protein